MADSDASKGSPWYVPVLVAALGVVGSVGVAFITSNKLIESKQLELEAAKDAATISEKALTAAQAALDTALLKIKAAGTAKWSEVYSIDGDGQAEGNKRNLLSLVKLGCPIRIGISLPGETLYAEPHLAIKGADVYAHWTGLKSAEGYVNAANPTIRWTASSRSNDVISGEPRDNRPRRLGVKWYAACELPPPASALSATVSPINASE